MATTKINRMTLPHVDEAKVFLDKIRTLRGEIPRLVPEVPSDTKKLVPVAKLSDKFLESASVALQVSARLEQACGVDASTLRDSFGYALAYSAVVQEFRALSRAMAHTIRVQRAEAAQSALDVYAFAQRLSAQKDGAELLPYVEDMRKKLNSGRTRKASSKPASKPTAPPTPPITKV